MAAQLLQRQPATATAPPAPASTTAATTAAPAEQLEPILLRKVASGGRRTLDVLALVPHGALASGAAEVPILLHLHGISVIAGHNYAHMLRNREVPPEYAMTEQLQAANAKPGSRMIAVLPVGETVEVSKKDAKSKSYTVDFGGFDADTLATQAIARLVSEGQLPKGSSAGGVVLSAHSGGGFDAKGAASGKKVIGMFAFESIHGDLAQYQALLEGKLAHDLAGLQALAAPAGAAPAAGLQAFQSQRQYLLEKGFRFVGFAGSNPGYRKRFRALRDAIHAAGGWIEKHDAELRKASPSHYADLAATLAANYQFNIEDKGNHFTVVAEGHLQQAMGALPASMGGGGATGAGKLPPAPAKVPASPAKLVTAQKPAAAAAAAAPTTTIAKEPVITFGPNARKEAVAASSLAILTDILKAAGLSKATITSTARSADDQARAMYQNLVSVGVDAQRALYGANGRLVIDTFEQFEAEGKSPQEVQDGMRDRIVEIGPSKVSRHCGDFHVLNVFDVGPGSLGGTKARKAFATAAKAEVGKRVSNFIPWPKDPGMHLEIKPSGSGGGSPAAAAAGPAKTMPPPATSTPAAPAKEAPAKATVPEKKKAEAFVKEHFGLSTKAVVVVKGQKATKKVEGMAKITADPAAYCAEILRDAKIDPVEWYNSFTSGVKFLGRPVRDPIHTDLAEHLREREGRLAEKYGGPDKDPAVAGKTLGLRDDEEIVGARDHPTSAAVSMHLFGLALDVNYTANPFVSPGGSTEKAVLANAGRLVTGAPVGFGKMKYDDLHRVNSVLVEYLSYLSAGTSAKAAATLDAKLAAAKEAPWAGLKRDAALALIEADFDTVTALWQRTKKKQKEAIQQTGFMDLSKELVEGMKMDWGAAYGDIMHFDLRDQGRGQEIQAAVRRYLAQKKKESKEQWAAEHPG